MRTHDPDFDPDPTAKPIKVGRCLDAGAALSSHYWGVIAVFTWWLPLLGLVAAAAGLIRGYQGWHSTQRLNARIGVVLSVIALGVMLWIFGWIVTSLQNMGSD